MKYLIPFVLAVTLAQPAEAAAPIAGKWMTTEKDSIVEIAPCGPKLCGKIVRILKPNPNGPMIDSNNPNPAMRNRPIQNMQILSDFVDKGKNWLGSIYDPRRGKSYKSKVTRLANGTLKVEGCIGPFCEGFIWTPVG